MLTKDEMKNIIDTTINASVKELGVRLEKEIDSKTERKVKDKITEINDRLDSLTFENVQLREQLEKVWEN